MIILNAEETGLAIKYWSFRSKYKQENCELENKICCFCNVVCNIPSFDEWLNNYRKNKQYEI